MAGGEKINVPFHYYHLNHVSSAASSPVVEGLFVAVDIVDIH